MSTWVSGRHVAPVLTIKSRRIIDTLSGELLDLPDASSGFAPPPEHLDVLAQDRRGRDRIVDWPHRRRERA
jgi:hypothetical protein